VRIVVERGMKLKEKAKGDLRERERNEPCLSETAP